MDEKKYKPDTKGKITKLAGDLQKVLGVRTPTAPSSPSQGGESAKKP
jgi:hypothetical protein